MDIGYVILLLLVLVYASAAVFLYLRAQHGRIGSEETPEVPPEEPEAPS
jgi:hypothetical protein